jgi:hypothetical protein
MTEPIADPADLLVPMFQDAMVDYVPDPMVLRAADLFIGGKDFVKKIYPDSDNGIRNGAEVTKEKVWATIDKNIDGLIAFFHLLMTRDRIPLIDYDSTFNDQNFRTLGDIAVPLHPPFDVYQRFKKDAQNRIKDIDLRKLPRSMIDDIAEELVSSGYGWLPEAGLDELDATQRTAAGFLMGGLIFGSYAAAIRGDHLLQSKRARLFMELTIKPDQRTQWGWEKESELFAELDKIALRDPHIATRDRPLPPTVLTLLVENAKSPRDLLDQALRLREEDEWKQYRAWYARLRKAWDDGSHDPEAELDVLRATEEIGKRLAQRRNEPVPLREKEVAFKFKLGVDLGGVKAEAEAGNLEQMRLPDYLRNWFVDTFRMRSHRKLLMRMSLEQQRYANLTLGLRNVWEGRRA